MSEENKPTIEMRRIYVRDISFESPHAAEGAGKDWKPTFSLNMNNETHKLKGDDLFELRLRCTLTCRNNKKTAYIAEIEQAAIFAIKGFVKEEMNRVLNTFCPNTLFPYIRETVDNLVVKGGFPPVMLAPINFEHIFEQSLKEKQQTGEENEEQRVTH